MYSAQLVYNPNERKIRTKYTTSILKESKKITRTYEKNFFADKNICAARILKRIH